MNILEAKYKNYIDKKICINMSRGIPDICQLNISNNIFDIINPNVHVIKDGIDYRNYCRMEKRKG